MPTIRGWPDSTGLLGRKSRSSPHPTRSFLPGQATSPKSGQWNSENKLLNRTHPVPTPEAQWPVPEGTPPPWANPEIPE